MIGLNFGTYSSISNSRSTSHADHCLAHVEDGLQMVNWSTSDLFFLAALHHDESQLTKARLFISERSNRREARNGVWERSTLNWRLHAMTINLHDCRNEPHLVELHDIQEAISSLPFADSVSSNSLYARRRIYLAFAYPVHGNIMTTLDTCLNAAKLLKSRPICFLRHC